MDNLPVDATAVEHALACGAASSMADAMSAIGKTREDRALSLKEISAIAAHADSCEAELFQAAEEMRRTVYGHRMILFAPLYWSSHCVNQCSYCGFQCGNKEVARLTLSDEEVVREARVLASRGYRRVLLESGEDLRRASVERLCEIMSVLYGVRDSLGRPCIDRINVNVAATSESDYRMIHEAGAGTYNLFQETYHESTYRRVHGRGPKGDYVRQLTAHDRAIRAGIGDVGLGVLWGLHDWKFELISMIAHAQYLENKFGFGPHTFSVPRIKAAVGVGFTPPRPVTDAQLLRIIAILRIAVPSAGIVISTREPAELRRRSFKIGVSQTSAGSSTDVGGYSATTPSNEQGQDNGQFLLDDRRSLHEVVCELLEEGFIPAFCTACEQRGREGAEFARFARTGMIGNLCAVNSVMALCQYLVDGLREGFVDDRAEKLIRDLLKSELAKQSPLVREEIWRALERIGSGGLAIDEYI